jgi:hypothetical protein
MNTESEKTISRFATVYGSPGQGPRTLGPLRVFWPLAPICLLAGYLFRAALPVPALSVTQAGVLLLALAVGMAFFTRWSALRLRSFLIGADGEEKAARILSFLPADHTVFNDLNLDAPGADFDHIVVAPTGLFLIETKTWSGELSFENGQVLCDGAPPHRPPLKQVKEAAAQLSAYLEKTQCPEAPVYPVLCFVGNQIPDEVSNIGGVRICTDRTLHELFENILEPPLEKGALAMITNELIRRTEA